MNRTFVLTVSGTLFGLAVFGFLSSSRSAAAQERQALAERFRQLDQNQDEILTPDELTQPAIFARLDLNKDGKIPRAEAREAFENGSLSFLGSLMNSANSEETTEAAALSQKELTQKAVLLKPSAHGVGRFVDNYNFSSLDGTSHELRNAREFKATVIAMTSTTCPLSRKYLPTLQELARRYADQQVLFILVNPMQSDPKADMQMAVSEFPDGVFYVHDPDEELADHAGALTTTDVIVLDSAQTVVYHGAIDDQYGIGYSLEEPRQRFLADALDAILEGRSISIAATQAPGCALEENDAQPAVVGAGNITWHNRISRIAQTHCMECHRSGGAGPFGLETYEEFVGHAPMIRQVVERGAMPPWFAEPSADDVHSPWANDRSLAPADKADLLAWLSSDRPVGDESEAPKPVSYPSVWTIGEPDLIVQIPAPISIKADGIMPYQFVTAETQLKEDQWIQAYEIIPTDSSVVHHVIVNAHQAGEGRIRDREEGIGGYFAAYVPGNASRVYPDGYARKLEAGSILSFQIHYTPNGTATEDQLRIGLRFSKKKPEYIVRTVSLADIDLNIPPNEPNHIESITRPVAANTAVMAYMAHMHVRGKSFQFELIKPDGESETLLNIPRYDFNWQLRYEYQQPKVIPAGSRVKVTAVFDNSDQNPANPDPSKTVRWGQQTHEEMMIGYVETFAPVDAPAPSAAGKLAELVLFQRFDADGNGTLSSDEATEAAKTSPRLKDRPELMKRVFERLDSDSNDELTPEEFARFRQILGTIQ
ncbi:MAG: redoxin family protein [Planctomyces sp.]|nr:redoxin family protein [Planctomyces sp.]